MFKFIEPVAICDQFDFLPFTQIEHEVVGESPDISPNLFIKPLCGYTIEFSKIRIEHNPLAVDDVENRVMVLAASLKLNIDVHVFVLGKTFQRKGLTLKDVLKTGSARAILEI